MYGTSTIIRVRVQSINRMTTCFLKSKCTRNPDPKHYYKGFAFKTIDFIVNEKCFCIDCYEPLCITCQTLHASLENTHKRFCRGAIHIRSSRGAHDVFKHVNLHRELEVLRAQQLSNINSSPSTSTRVCADTTCGAASSSSPHRCEACKKDFCSSQCFDRHCTAVLTGRRETPMIICPVALAFEAKFPLIGEQFVS
jgi:hypothetical protein